MTQGIQVAGLYVRDQDEALAFYVEKLGFRVHTDVRNGDYRWLTVQHPEQPSFQLGLFAPGAPVLDAHHRVARLSREADAWRKSRSSIIGPPSRCARCRRRGGRSSASWRGASR